MGSVVAAVSPAVIVPKMIRLMEEGYGTDNSIPQLILAGASVDDVFVIVLFSAFTGLAQGGRVSPVSFVQIIPDLRHVHGHQPSEEAGVRGHAAFHEI